MEPKVNYIVVGGFVLLLGLTVLGGIFWLGKTDYRGIYDRYYVYTRESVSGLSVDSTVKYRGVDVGRVKAVVLNPENPEEVRVTLDIVAGTPVKTDTQAMLVTQGLTGLVTLNLTGGTREAPPLSPEAGQAYPVIKSVPSLFGRLDGTLAKLLSDQGLANLVVHLSGLAQNASLMVDEENRTLVKQVLKDLAAATAVLAAQSGRLDRGIQGATLAAEQTAKVTERIGTQLPALLDRIGKTAAGLQQLTEEWSRTSRSVGDMVGTSKPGVEQFTRQTLADAGLLVTELRQLTATLNRVAQQVERQPNLLVLGRSSQSKGPGSEGSLVADPQRLSRLVLVMVACTLTACVLPRSTDSPVHTFVLTAEETDGGPVPALPRVAAQGVLLVGVPQAAAGFEQARIAYLQRPSEVNYYADHFWVDPPSRMLTPVLIRALEQSGYWRVVAPMPSALRADHQLDVSGLVVQQEFLQKPSRSRVRLRAQLTDLKRQQVMGARSFERVEAAPSEDAYGGVLAANRAVSAVLAAVNDWIAGCLREADKEVC